MWGVDEIRQYLEQHLGAEWAARIFVPLALLVVLWAFIRIIKAIGKEFPRRSADLPGLRAAVLKIPVKEREYVFLVLYGWLIRQFGTPFEPHAGRNAAHQRICEIAGISKPLKQPSQLGKIVADKIRDQRIELGTLALQKLQGHVPKATPILDYFAITFARADPSQKMNDALREIETVALQAPSPFTPLMVARLKEEFRNAR